MLSLMLMIRFISAAGTLTLITPSYTLDVAVWSIIIVVIHLIQDVDGFLLAMAMPDLQ